MSLSLKDRALATIDAKRDELVRVSTTLHENPEIAFQEFKSAGLLCDTLEKYGFKVERGVGGLETAFRAEARGQADGPTIAILAEYDALPDIGHACGHNIMAAASIGAGIAVKSVLEHLPGRLLVIGTPAEEGGGGKVILVEHGLFKDVDAAMIVHPSSRTMVSRTSLASMRLMVEFNGKASHAAAAPEDGINALEAVILTFNNINALRLHLKPDARVHGIITNGGSAANIIPEYASATFSVRAAKQAYADKIMQRVIQCAQAGAAATGATLKYVVKPGYAEMMPNMILARTFANNWEQIGIPVKEPRFDERMGYGALDRELGERLFNAGVEPRQIRHRAACVHLDHARDYLDAVVIANNQLIRRATRAGRLSWTPFGIRQPGRPLHDPTDEAIGNDPAEFTQIRQPIAA